MYCIESSGAGTNSFIFSNMITFSRRQYDSFDVTYRTLQSSFFKGSSSMTKRWIKLPPLFNLPMHMFQLSGFEREATVLRGQLPSSCFFLKSHVLR